MEFFDVLTAARLDNIGAVGIIVTMAVLVITGRLVWHTQLTEAKADAKRWEKIALDLLISAKAGVVAAEVTAAVVSNLPDPEGDRIRSEQETAL